MAKKECRMNAESVRESGGVRVSESEESESECVVSSNCNGVSDGSSTVTNSTRAYKAKTQLLLC